MSVGKDLGFFATLRMTLIRGVVTSYARVSLHGNDDEWVRGYRPMVYSLPLRIRFHSSMSAWTAALCLTSGL